MSCLWFWCCRGQQSDSDTENKANDEELKNGKIKKKKKWRTRKRREQQKKEQMMDEEKAENIQVSQQPAAGQEQSDAPLVPAGLVPGSLENISAVISEKTGTPLHEEVQTSEDVPEASSDLKDASLDQIEAEAEAEAITTQLCTDPEEQEPNNQPLAGKLTLLIHVKRENVELTMTTAEAEAEAIEQLMNIDLDETEDSMEQHLAGDEMFEATLTEAEVEAVKQLMLLFIDQIEAESLGSEVMNVPDTEPEAQVETYLDEVNTPNDLPLAEEEILEVMDTEDEAEVSKDLVHLKLHDTETEYLAGDEMFEATLTEAEVEAVKQLMLLFVDRIEAESLGCEVMSAAETEAEASGLNRQTHLDEAVRPNDHPLDVEKTFDAETDWSSIKRLMADLLSDVERRADHSLGNEMDKVTDAEAEADDLENLMDIQLDETDATAKQGLGTDVEISTDPEPIKSWADIIDETEGTTNQSAETKTLKDFPGNEAKPNQQKRKTRRGTRGKGRKINYKKGPRREE
ncbi:hypothetical protein MHYP_G00172830 [Metynnis hypsauchen]